MKEIYNYMTYNFIVLNIRQIALESKSKYNFDKAQFSMF